MRFTPDLLDEIRTRLPVSQVVARRVKLKRRGREFVGLSPFKFEKTPSFTVNDQKGFYHCFASGEHGDIFTFVMKTEGLDFPEAVERLAGEAGVHLPKATPREAENAEARSRLHEVMAAAALFFEQQLSEKAGASARDYLLRREVSDEQRGLFRLGYAPNDRSALKAWLSSVGYTNDEMVQAGLLIAGDDIPVSYDRFRDRIIFPITDLKGRVIAFGGRALDPDQPAKYLNSPETPLFHKGGILFNAAVARQAAYDAGTVIVAEGYMDVIALSGAGLANTVAPLGTALTENQLKLLWRMAPEPILCFDGDEAGRKAAYRSIDLALPLLQPGKSLRFAFLPDGQDPDDVIREAGGAAIRALLDKAKPLVDVVWFREQESGDWSTPERRAALERRVLDLAGEIGDPIVRAHYTENLRSRLREAFGRDTGSYGPPFRPASRNFQGKTGGLRRTPANGPVWRGKSVSGISDSWRFQSASSELLRSGLMSDGLGRIPEREALLMQTLINHPWLIEDYLEEISGLRLESKTIRVLLDALLELHAGQNPLDTKVLRPQLRDMGLSRELARQEQAITHKSVRYAECGASDDDVKAGWKHLLALHCRGVALRQEVDAAEQAYQNSQTEDNESRLLALVRQLEQTESGEAGFEGKSRE